MNSSTSSLGEIFQKYNDQQILQLLSCLSGLLKHDNKQSYDNFYSVEQINTRFYFSVGDDTAGGKNLAVVREQDENRFSSNQNWVGVSRGSKILIRKKLIMQELITSDYYYKC